MGVVNVTPDSFSDGGRWFDADAAIIHGRELAAEGADLVDVGGESTRPGAQRPDVTEELRRVVPVVRELAASGAVVSVDTMRAQVAAAAVEAGATAVNDVSGGLADADMLPFVAEAGVPYVCMHWRAHSARMDEQASYGNVVRDVVSELTERRDAALAAGVQPERLALDPGLGFAKSGEHNWALLGDLASLHALGHPLLLGASRKRFLGTLLADPASSQPRALAERDDATAAVSTLSASKGVWCVRVHAVRASLDAVRVVARWASSDTVPI